LISIFTELTDSYIRSSRDYTLGAGPWKYLKRRRLGRLLDSQLEDIVRAKFQEGRTQPEKSTTAGPRSVLSLSLSDVKELTPAALSSSRDHVKAFLFAGHETTSNMLQWTLYELSRTPHALDAVHSEIKAVFGADASPGSIRALLCENGCKYISQLVYISCVIKEVLRLHTATGSAGYAPPNSGFHLHPPESVPLSLDGMVTYTLLPAIQRDESVYGSTNNDFLPERWLTKTEAECGSSIPPTAWRPFERGPRNCIGQDLTNIEARVVLVLALSRYEFEKVGLGQIARDSKGNRVLGSKRQYRVESELFDVSAWLNFHG
jgi:cytochrome P450